MNSTFKDGMTICLGMGNAALWLVLIVKSLWNHSFPDMSYIWFGVAWFLLVVICFKTDLFENLD